MSVFLRWGVFGILAVAALVYAYNASKDLANRRASAAPVAPAPQAMAPVTPEAQTPPDVARAEGPADASCELEVLIAQRAIEARDAREPLDRLLRMREIAFEEDAGRRERLTRVATRWFGHEGPIGPFSVRREAAAECVAATPR